MILYTALLVFGIVAMPVGIFILRAYLAVGGMTLSETSRINDGVFCINERFVVPPCNDGAVTKHRLNKKK